MKVQVAYAETDGPSSGDRRGSPVGVRVAVPRPDNSPPRVAVAVSDLINV